MRVPGLRQLTQTGINNLAQWDIPCPHMSSASSFMEQLRHKTTEETGNHPVTHHERGPQ